MRESLLEKKFVKFCSNKGWLSIKQEGFRGISDRLVIADQGRIFFVELKRDQSQRLSPAQIEFHAFLQKNGHKTYVFRSVQDFEVLNDID